VALLQQPKLSGGSIVKRKVLVLLMAVAFLAGVRTYAHHSFAATYFEDKKMTIEGELVQFLYRNPHSFVHVMAPDDKGQMQRWSVEWGGGGQLARQGVGRETLKVGDKVIITGDPGRNPADHRLRMRTITRPADGWKWGGEID
jgi:uncharacterized protein DUF6152